MSIKIKHGKLGYHLIINGLYISFEHGQYNCVNIRAIECEDGIPYGATQWVSVAAIRSFWSKYMLIAIWSTLTPYVSVWGSLVKK